MIGCDAEACDAVAQKMAEQIIPQLAVQGDTSAEPRELGSEDPGRSAKLQAVIVDEHLRLAPNRYVIAPDQEVDAEIGDHGNIELHIRKRDDGCLSEG